MPRWSAGSQRVAGRVSVHSSTSGAPAVRYGWDPVPYGAGRPPAFRAVTRTVSPSAPLRLYSTSRSRRNGYPGRPSRARRSTTSCGAWLATDRAGHPVAAAIDAVGPRQQQLAGPPGGKLVGLVPGDQRLAAMPQLTQPRAQFGDGGEVLSRGDLVLRSGEQAHGRTVAAGIM